MKHAKKAAVVLILVLVGLIGAYVYSSYIHTGSAHEISVILRSGGNGFWDAGLRGMEQAAREKSVTLNFVTFEEDAEYMAAIRREIDYGVSAVIIEPCEGDLLLDRGMRDTVLIQIGGSALAELPAIAPDNEALGRDLAKLALRGGAPYAGSVCIAESADPASAATARVRGLCAELDALGISYMRLRISQDRDASRDELRELVNVARGGCILAVEPSILLRCGYRLYESGTTDVAAYGIGMTPQINALMERGYIKAILATDQYKEGYLAVAAAVDILQGRLPRKGGGQILAHTEVSADTLFNGENLYLLYPFVR